MVISVKQMVDLLGYRIGKFIGQKLGYTLFGNEEVLESLLAEMHKADCYKLSMEVLGYLYGEALHACENYNASTDTILDDEDDPFGLSTTRSVF